MAALLSFVLVVNLVIVAVDPAATAHSPRAFLFLLLSVIDRRNGCVQYP